MAGERFPDSVPARKYIVRRISKFDWASLPDSELLRIRAITIFFESGLPLPNDFYRLNRQDPKKFDDILDRHGVIHLHLTKGSDRMLLIRVHGDAIYYLGVYDHTIFAEKPKGASVFRKVEPELSKSIAVQDAASKKAEAAASLQEPEKAKNLRGSLKPRRPRP